MTNLDPAKLREILVDKEKVVDAAVFDKLFGFSNDLAQLIAKLLKDKAIPLEKLNEYLQQIYGVKYINVAARLIQPEVLQRIPKDFSIEQELVVFGLENEKLQVAMVDPGNLYALEYIKRKTGLEPEIYLTDREALQTVIKGFKSDIQNLFSDVLNQDSKKVTGKSGDIKDLAEGVPITRAVNAIIEYGVSEGASDIHIEPTENEVIIRFRIDGILHDMLVLLKSIHSLIAARIKIMADLKIDEHRRPQDGRIKMKVNDLPISLRVSILPTHFGEKIVMRILDESSRDLTLKDIGFQGDDLATMEEAISKPDGMILVTGPTGSGKTTTLYTVMKILNTPEVNINTVEDPIEYSMPRINQSQVNPTIGFTFANGLRTLLRQDPDIIMVGEIRDGETAGMAINAALTGHLVLSTLHTNDAPSTIPRFVDMGAEPFLLASTLNLAIAQRLVRKLCNNCKYEEKLDASTAKIIQRQFAELELPAELLKKYEKIKIHKAAGCVECGNSGYKGRSGLFEMVKMTDALRQLIIDKAAVHVLRREMIAQGHLPMFIKGLEMIDQGITSLEEVIRVASE